MGLRSDFIWGAATAAIQIEGAGQEGGRSLSNWDVFSEIPGAIKGGDSPLEGVDHYRRMRSDVMLMKELGIRAYRFSISWPRILPQGTGEVNQDGLRFYNELVDTLLEVGITPYVTLYHWDLPYNLHLQGGFLNPAMPSWMENYAKVVVDALSDRVSNWITLNEPQCFLGLAYKDAVHAPGWRLSDREMALAVHNTLLCHGKILHVIRTFAKTKAKVAFVQATPFTSVPVTEKDIEAARERQFMLSDSFANSGVLYTDAIYRGKYPDEYLSRYQDILPVITDDDMRLISAPLDYFGLNLYGGDFVQRGVDGKPVVVPRIKGYARTALDWDVRPEIMYWTLKFCYERYRVPILVTENGMSGNDWIHVDGHIHDADRIDFLHRYLKCMRSAVDDGVDIRGYFHWSLFDNFEWSLGFAERFGLVFVDYVSGERTIKDSGYWYRDIVQSNGLSL